MATATQFASAVARDSVPKDGANASVRVEIFDQGYSLRGSDPDYITKLAAYVDQKMRAVAEQTNTVDTARLAVLAALNIADELHLMRNRVENRSDDYRQRTHRLANALDEALGEKLRAG